MGTLIKLLHFILLLSNPSEYSNQVERLDRCISMNKTLDSNPHHRCYAFCEFDRFRDFYRPHKFDLVNCPADCIDLMAQYKCITLQVKDY